MLPKNKDKNNMSQNSKVVLNPLYSKVNNTTSLDAINDIMIKNK